MIEFNEERYRRCRAVPLAMKPIATGLDIRLSAEALHMQRLVFGIGTLFDDTLDRGTQADQQAVLSYWKSQAQGGQPQTNPDGIVLPRLISDIQELHEYLTPHQARTFYQHGKQVVKLTRRCRIEDNPSAYHNIRAKEAELAFRMVVSTVPVSEQRHPNFSHYVYLGGIVGRIAGSVDTVADLWDDAKRGLTRVPRAPSSYKILSRLAFRETTKGIALLGYKTTARMLGKAARYYRHGASD